jgi:predicted phage-related endonuclease
MISAPEGATPESADEVITHDRSMIPPARPRRGAGRKRQPRMVPVSRDRRGFIGGSDARIIMGQDDKALQRLWREKRGELEPEDLSSVLIVRLGQVTEALNRQWYETQSGHSVTDVQARLRHPVHHFMAATLDGKVDPGVAVLEDKFFLQCILFL